MNGIPAQCQPIKDKLDTLQDLRDSLQELFEEAVGAGNKQAIRQQIINLNKKINDAEKELQECISPSPPRISNLAIIGIEMTQATQFFRPATLINPPSGRCPVNRMGLQPENDIKLVAGKTTILRVYVDATTDPVAPIISTLSGILETRAAGSGTWHLPLTPYNAPINPQPGIAIYRGIANHTLNFRIPPARCHGMLETKVTVFDSAHPGETGYTSGTVSRQLQFTNISPFTIRLVRIRYANAARGMNFPAPTLADFWSTAQYVLKTFPIPGITIIRDSEALYDGDFTDISPAGNIPGSGNWGTTGSLYHILNPLVAAEGLGSCTHYLALVPGAANQSGASGWAVGQTAIANAFNGPTLAQELAHLCSRNHAPCGNPPGPDPCFPIYVGYPSASIGEVGFDYATSQVYDPAKTFDFMSYCGPTWVSPYTYEGLMKCCMGPAVSGGSGEGTQAEISPIPQEILHLSCIIYRDSVIVLKSPSFHIEGYLQAESGQPTPFFVELHDKDGHILRAKRIYNNDMHTSLDDAYINFSVALPWQDEAAKVVFKREDQILHSVDIEQATPEVRLNAPFGGKTMTGQQTISWSVSGLDQPISSIVRYSNDEGRTWLAVATGITVNELILDFDNLPGGGKCVIQVLASTGLRTGKANSEPFIVVRKPLKATIISPKDGTTVVEGESVHIFGFAHSPEGSAKPDELTWSSNIDGFLGSGAEAVVNTLSVGRHRITLNTDNGCGEEGSACIHVTVRPREYQ